MRRRDTVTIWAATPVKAVVQGEPQITGWSSVREVTGANWQTDRDAADVAAYGEQLNQIIKLRFVSCPSIAQGDHIFTAKPADDANRGEYEVNEVRPGYTPTARRRNPTVVTVRKLV
ncbi:MAG: hypothetical protein IJX53_00680 [Clostridia bacterium]|nr:hypothetical protein [Clostridia bacterium]